MSQILQQILALIELGEVRISAHGYDEMAVDDILIREVMAGAKDAVAIEDYPHYPKGPCVLVLQLDHQDKPLHVVRGIPKDASSPAVLVTAYRPNPRQWSSDFMRRNR